MSEPSEDKVTKQAGREGQATAFSLVVPTDYSAVPTNYANFVQVTASPHDFRLVFGLYSFPQLPEPRPSEVEVPIQPVESVVVPLNLVRGLIRALEAQAENWERNFNEPLPEQPRTTGTEES